jgi:hypothetical protein
VPIAKDLLAYGVLPTGAGAFAMSDIRIFTAPTIRINEAARDQIALGIWFAVLTGVLFLTRGHSILMTAGLMLELTAAYSTFVICGKPQRSPLVHGIPYAFALTGAIFLCLAPHFQNAIQASLAFAAVIVFMHGFVVYGARKSSRIAEEPACATAV